MRKALFTLTLAALALGGATSCGAHKKMTDQVDTLSNRVESMGQALEQTQERTRQNETRIGTVDTRAGAAQSAAAAAQTAASAADAKAGAAADSVRTVASQTTAQIDALGRRMVYSAALSEDQGGFSLNSAELPAAAKAKLDEIAQRAKSDAAKGAYFDIEGYTDGTGSKDVNERLGLARANAVKRYLHDQHQIPLYRMNVISYGADNPTGDNKTRAGRAQNRRVVIKVWM